VDLQAPVDALGEVETVVPVRIIDRNGFETEMPLQVTTGVATARLEGGGEIAVAGEPLGADGRATLVAVGTVPNGSLEGQVYRLVLNVQVDPDASPQP